MLRKEFYSVISDEENALRFAETHGLISFIRRPCLMPGCIGLINFEKGKTRHSINKRWRCNKRNCRHTASLFHNTIFDHSHFSISQILELIYTYCENDSMTETADKLGIDRYSVRTFYKKIDDIIVAQYDHLQESGKIGDEYIVEMDETHLFKRMYHRGRILRAQSYWVIGAYERVTKKIKL